MYKKRIGLAVGVPLLALAALPSLALADHTHVRHVGNGSCVILAANGAEKHIVLPESNPFIESQPENRRHPMHVLVHLGEPGEHGTIQVLGSDTCTDYLNGD